DDDDSDAESEKVLKVGNNFFRRHGHGHDDDDDDSDAESEKVLKVGNNFFRRHGHDDDDDSDAESEKVLKVGNHIFRRHGHDDDGDAESEEVIKVGVDLDGINISEMKCDSEGSNEMAGGWFSCVPRKARSSGPFFAGSGNFKDCVGNVINCIELGKQIRFDADSIDVIHSHNPMFILLVEKRSTAKDFYRVLFDRGYRCIIVATRRRSLDDATIKFVCNLQKMSNLQVYALFDCSPHFIKIMSDLIHRDRMDLIWLGIQPRDVLALLEIQRGILTTPMTDTELLEDNSTILEHMGLHIVRIKAFPADTLIRYYLPKLTCGVPGF
ncbi:DNA topoisomerase 6 subunit A, partial [Tanacetum coccineum]